MRGAFPISLLMPLSPRRVPSRLFLPWAANLLPEATQLKAIGLQLGASPADVIGILSELGRDTAGALSIGRARHGKPRLAPDPRRQGAGAHPRRAAVKAVSRRRGRRVDVARRRADQARRRHRRQGPHLRADQRRAVDVDPEAGFGAPVRRRAERGAVPGAGQAARPQRAGGHHRQGGQAHLSDGEALRPRRAARPLAPPAPGGFLPGARQAAVGEVRDRTRPASPARRWRRCSP